MLDLTQPIQIDPAWLPAHAIDELAKKHHLTAGFSKGEKKRLKRKKYVPPSKWVPKNIMVPSDSPTGKRYWDPEIGAYWLGPMDASFYPSVQEISVCAVPQSGKSQFISNCLGYAIENRPGNIIFCMSDEDLAGEYTRDRFIPMIENSPALSAHKTGYADDLASNRVKLQHLKFYPAWARSATKQASKPAPYGVADEENKYPATVNKQELKPIDLLRMRARNFSHMRKLWRSSSPTIESETKGDKEIKVGISAALAESEVIFDYYVRCPDCGALQLMVFDRDHFKWEGGGSVNPDDVIKENAAWYECDHCHAIWGDAKRNMAVRMGQWFARITNEDGDIIDRGLELFAYLHRHNPIKIAFQVPAWLSYFVSLSECVAAFIKGLSDTNDYKAFCNNIKGEPWKIIKKERKESAILALRDDRPRGRVPGGGVVAGITAFVDTQDHGFWYEIRAWGWGGPELSKDSWGVKEGYETSWGDLERVLWGEELLDADGNRYVISLIIQDALGHRTAEVYDFCLKHRNKVFPSFGKDVMAQPYTWTNLEFYPGTKKPLKGGLKGLNINTKHYKDELSRLLEIVRGDPSSWRYHAEFPEPHAKQMTAEFQNEKGLWECPKHLDNHLWDCAAGNLVAADLLGIKFWKKPEPGQTAKPKRRVLSRGINA